MSSNCCYLPKEEVWEKKIATMIIVLVSDRQRNAPSKKLSKSMILARYFIHVWIGVHDDGGDDNNSIRL